MLTYNDPFRGLDTLFDQLSSARRTAAAPLDAYRRGDEVWAHIDLPGVAADSIDIDIERSVLTVTAERGWQAEEGDQLYLNERHQGTFRRQLNLGEGLDADRIEADYHDGVLTLRIPLAEKAKPRKVSIKTSGQAQSHVIETNVADES